MTYVSYLLCSKSCICDKAKAQRSRFHQCSFRHIRAMRSTTTARSFIVMAVSKAVCNNKEDQQINRFLQLLLWIHVMNTKKYSLMTMLLLILYFVKLSNIDVRNRKEVEPATILLNWVQVFKKDKGKNTISACV